MGRDAKTPQQRIKELEEKQKADRLAADRAYKFAAAQNELAGFESAMMARAESWMIAARNIGSAYKMAAEEHKKALEAQKASDALSDQILFSILTVASAGALSWISSSVQARTAATIAAAQQRLGDAKQALEAVKNMPGPLAAQARVVALDRVKHLEVMPKPVGMIMEGIEDSLQAASGEVFSAMGPMLAAYKLTEASEDPQVFQNEEENRIGAVKQSAFEAFAKVRSDWQKQSPEYWDNYDIKKEQANHAEWQKEAATLAGHDDLRSVPEMANELERGIWRRYILESHSHRDFGIFRTAESYDFVGYHVIMRLAKLGVTQPLGILTEIKIGNVTKPQPIPEGMMDPALIGPNSEMYIDRLVKWAKSYQVKSLLKAKPAAAAAPGRK